MSLLPPSSLPAPLYEIIGGINETNEGLKIDTGSLFWSVGRLFGYYERAMKSLEISRFERELLESDIESFIIRMRIILNDISFMIRQLLPVNAQGIANPKGETHPKNREMSITALHKSLIKGQGSYPEFYEVFQSFKAWTDGVRNARDNLLHYKTRVLVFEDDKGCYFALVNPAETHPIDPETGRIKLKRVDDFLNEQLVTLHRLMHDTLPLSIRTYASRTGIQLRAYRSYERVGGPGIERFRNANNIHFPDWKSASTAQKHESPAQQ